jgi:serine/threonine protein kinase
MLYHITHGDIKPKNILITDYNQIKLINFSFFKQIQYTLTNIEIQAETYIYMSPEIIHKKYYFSSTDFWSLGIIIYELMTLNHPFSYILTQYTTLINQQAIPQYDNLHYSSKLINF